MSARPTLLAEHLPAHALSPMRAVEPPLSAFEEDGPDKAAELVAAARAAHVALMRGDLEGHRRAVTIASDFTLMSPFGGQPTSAETLTKQRWDAIARFFANGTESTLQPVRVHTSDDMVVIAAIERTQAEVGGLEAQPWALRVTLVFRRAGSRWDLVHRHADPLAAGIGLDEAAVLARRALSW